MATIETVQIKPTWTAGPWRIRKFNDTKAWTIYGNNGSLARVKAEANARLIAAAPELADAAILGLEAIDTVLSSHEGQFEHAQLKAAFDALEAALAKAMGA